MHLQRILQQAKPNYPMAVRPRPLGSIAGHEITLELGTQRAIFAIGGLDASSTFTLKVAEMDDKPSGTITRLENLAENLPRHLATLRVLEQDVDHRIHAARNSLGQPFKYETELAAAQQHYQHVSDALADSQRQQTLDPAPTSPPAAATQIAEGPSTGNTLAGPSSTRAALAAAAQHLGDAQLSWEQGSYAPPARQPDRHLQPPAVRH